MPCAHCPTCRPTLYSAADLRHRDGPLCGVDLAPPPRALFSESQSAPRSPASARPVEPSGAWS